MTLAQLVDEYLLDVARLYQPATERKYSQVLDFLLRDIGDKTPIESITESDILRCLYRWKDRKPATKALHTSIFKGCFDYAVDKNYLTVSPAAKIKRPKLPRAEDREVLIVSTDDIRRMFSSCQNWGEEICLSVLAYTGSRRNAVSMMRWKDIDLAPDPPHGPCGWMRFHEKADKVIDKPIPYLLREILDRAPAHNPEDYLVPNKRPNAVKRKERSNQIIYTRVKDIAKRAGVEAHVHAIRAAFAVFFLETHRGSMKSLQELLGHARLETTQHYVRGLDKKQAMAEGLGLDWGSALSAGRVESTSPVAPEREIATQEPPARPALSALSEGEWPSPSGPDSSGVVKTVSRVSYGTAEDSDSSSSPSESVLEVEERVL